MINTRSAWLLKLKKTFIMSIYHQILGVPAPTTVNQEVSFTEEQEDKIIEAFQSLMGMSGDYQLAIECGSTMIRVGSSIFGTR